MIYVAFLQIVLDFHLCKNLRLLQLIAMTHFAIPSLQKQHEWYIRKAIRIPEHINTLGSELNQEKSHISFPTRYSNYLLSLIPSNCHTTETKKNQEEACLFNLLSQTGEKYNRQCVEVIEEKTFYGEKTDADAGECYKDKSVIILTMEYTGSSV